MHAKLPDVASNPSPDLSQRLLWNAEELGTLVLGISRSKVFELAASGRLPQSYKLGKARKWRRHDIETWIRLGMPSMDQFEQLTQPRARRLA